MLAIQASQPSTRMYTCSFIGLKSKEDAVQLGTYAVILLGWHIRYIDLLQRISIDFGSTRYIYMYMYSVSEFPSSCCFCLLRLTSIGSLGTANQSLIVI